MKNNIILIGMPGAGKSTVGVLLAKELAKDFVDTDVLIQVQQKTILQDILDKKGYMELRRIEEQVLLNATFTNHVIATGGSAVYSQSGIEHLKASGIAIFMEVSIDVLRRRIHNYETRGIAKRPEQSFDELFEERRQLYVKYADLIIDCNRGTPDVIVDKIKEQLASMHSQLQK